MFAFGSLKMINLLVLAVMMLTTPLKLPFICVCLVLIILLSDKLKSIYEQYRWQIQRVNNEK